MIDESSQPYQVVLHEEFHADAADIASYIRQREHSDAPADNFSDDAYVAALTIDLFADVHAYAKGPPPRPAYFIPSSGTT